MADTNAKLIAEALAYADAEDALANEMGIGEKPDGHLDNASMFSDLAAALQSSESSLAAARLLVADLAGRLQHVESHWAPDRSTPMATADVLREFDRLTGTAALTTKEN